MLAYDDDIDGRARESAAARLRGESAQEVSHCVELALYKCIATLGSGQPSTTTDDDDVDLIALRIKALQEIVERFILLEVFNTIVHIPNELVVDGLIVWQYFMYFEY